MTPLHKPVSRRTTGFYRVLYAGRPRQVVVTLAPGDIIEFREAGCPTRFSLSIEDAFRLAVCNRAARDAEAKRKAKRERQKSNT